MDKFVMVLHSTTFLLQIETRHVMVKLDYISASEKHVLQRISYNGVTLKYISASEEDHMQSLVFLCNVRLHFKSM